jgi:hypothetical protein
MARRKPEEIIALVEQHDYDTDSLRSRFTNDYRLYRLEDFDAGEGYESYTSNEPQTYADKVISFMTDSELIVRVPYNNADEEQRIANDTKERFILGALRAADERLQRRLQPTIRQQFSWFVVVRGWYAGRVLLVKDSNGDTHIDVMPMDPLHTFWGIGQEGVEWACYRTKKTRSEIKAQYGVTIEKDNANLYSQDMGLEVYDYYDGEMNTVLTEGGRVLKKPTKHGAPRCPVFVGCVGLMPLIQDSDVTEFREAVTDYGESVYKATRNVYENHNQILSTLLELTARTKKQGLKVKSRDGTKTLEQDPYKAGSEIALAQGEDVEPLGLIETSRDLGMFMQMVAGEMQRGSLPHTVFGELQFQLSGFALNTLRQGIASVINPRIEALESIYKQICMLLVDEYLTDSFEAVELSGRAMNRTYFSEEITPDIIRKAGDAEISLITQLPQDDMTKYAMAQTAREGPMPLLPDMYIRDQILGLQDAESIDDAIKSQQAERTLPEATLLTMMKAAEDQGHADLAQMYMGELMFLMRQKMFDRQMQQQQQQGAMSGPEGMGGMGAPPPGGGGFDPQVMSAAAMGAPQNAPVPPQNGMRAPGQPRPGAGNEERLANIGLFGPGG